MLAIKNERENSIESSGFRLNRFYQTTDTYHVSDRHRYDYICRLSFLTYFFCLRNFISYCTSGDEK